MNTIQNNILTAILITTMSLCFTTTAQNADREEIQRQTERLRQPLGVKNDAEWAILSERIAKVIELRNAGGGRGGNRDDRARGGRQRDQGAGDRTQRNRGQGNRDGAEGNRDERERREGDRTRSGHEIRPIAGKGTEEKVIATRVIEIVTDGKGTLAPILHRVSFNPPWSAMHPRVK